jgi:hypothetical protein
MEDLRQELAVERELNRKYILDLETLLQPKELEQRAAALGLFLPTERDTVVLERVAPSPRPTRGIVAAR